jgi:hypothetical protein
MKLILAVLLVAGGSAYGKTLVVNNNASNTSSPCKTAAYTTIGAAITAANAGDTVEVCPGTYPEAVTINKANLKLIGLTLNNSSLVELEPTAGVTTTDVNPSAENPNENVILLVDSVSGVAISNISVNGYQATTTCGSGNAGIYFRNASGSVSDSAVSYIGLNPDGTVTGCQEGLGVYVDSGNGGTASLTITGTSVHDYDKAGIVATESGTTLVATGNTVTGAGPTTATAQNGIEVDYGAKGTANNNVITANDYTPSSSAGTSILFFESASNGQANDNIISETNNGIYFYSANNGTANGNNISKVFNYDGLATYQSNSDVLEKNTITRSGLETDNAAIYICGSHTKAESNAINEAPIGVYDDRTSADGCTGATGNTTTLNLYENVGEDAVIATGSPDALVKSLSRSKQSATPKVSPSK